MDLANFVHATGHLAGVGLAWGLLTAGFGIASLLAGNALACLLTHVLAIVLIRRVLNTHVLSRRLRFCRAQYVRILRFSSGLFTASILNLLLHPFNKLLLCRYAGPASLPIYQIAFQGALQLRALIQFPIRAIMPEVSRAAGAETATALDRITSTTHRLQRLITLLGLPCYGAALIVHRPLLQLWLGRSFAVSLAPVLMVMMVGSFLSLVGLPAYYMLMGMGEVRNIVQATACKVITNVCACAGIVLLTDWVSALAVSVAVTLGMGIQSVLLIVRRRHVAEGIRRETNRLVEAAVWRVVVPHQP
jgi:O-antigen/teichoic acid export membrane protein